MFLHVSEFVRQKIKEFHGVELIEAEEAFTNFNGKMLKDDA